MTGLLAVALLAAGERIAVIAVGDDTRAAGELQNALTSALREEDLVGSAEIALSIGVPDARPAPTEEYLATRARVKELLDEATSAYYEDRAPDLLATFTKLEAHALRPPEKALVSLWRATVYLGLGDPSGPRQQVQNALHFDPDLKPDPAVFSPEVRDLVEEEKTKITLIDVAVQRLPAGATVDIDDRRGPSQFRAPPGKHELTVWAPGFRQTRVTIEVPATGSLQVRVPMALAIKPDFARELAASALLGHAPDRAAEIAQAAGADILVVGALRNDPAESLRAIAWWRADERRVSSNSKNWSLQDARALAEWVGREIEAGRPSLRDRGWKLSASAAPELTVRQWAVEGRDAGRYAGTFAAFGPRLSARAGRGPWQAELEAWFASGEMSRVDAKFSDSGRESTTGGSHYGSRLWAGYRRGIGTPGEGEWLAIDIAAGIGAERLAIRDIEGSNGGLGMFPSYEKITPLWRLAVDARLSGGRREIVAGAFFGTSVGPMEYWETPPGTNGSEAGGGVSISTGVRASTRGRGPWSISGSYSFEQHNVQFDERSAVIPTDPPATKVVVAELFHRVAIGVRRQF